MVLHAVLCKPQDEETLIHMLAWSNSLTDADERTSSTRNEGQFSSASASGIVTSGEDAGRG